MKNAPGKSSLRSILKESLHSLGESQINQPCLVHRFLKTEETPLRNAEVLDRAVGLNNVLAMVMAPPPSHSVPLFQNVAKPHNVLIYSGNDAPKI